MAYLGYLLVYVCLVVILIGYVIIIVNMQLKQDDAGVKPNEIQGPDANARRYKPNQDEVVNPLILQQQMQNSQGVYHRPPTLK